MNIRPAQEADFEAVARLTNIYIAATPIHFSYDPATAAELRQSWEKSRDRYPFLVAEVEGVFAGFAKAGTWRDRTAYSWTAEVGIYVEPVNHRCGLGTALYRALLDAVRDRGFHSAIGGITLPNEASVRLHERLGFQRVGVFREVGWKLGAWHDVAFYQLMLQESGHRPA